MHRNERHADPVGCGRHALQVLIASEVRFVRESLGEILGRGGTTSVIGYCADFGQTLSMSRELRPDMVLLDAAVRDGPMAVRRLREISAGLRVVVFAVSESVESVLSWAEAGVAGYIPCTAGASDLCALVDDISAGRQACSGVVAAGLLQRIAASSAGPAKADSGPQALTPRELEIVRLISTGLSNKEIARRLNIGLTTTKSHVHNALGKLNVQRRGQVATWMYARSSPN
jgi:two-component system, NarL family, nitrate/nitrite response regulator NarL